MPYFWSFLPQLIHLLVALSHKNTSVFKTEVFLWNKERGREANGSDSEWSAGGKAPCRCRGQMEAWRFFRSRSFCKAMRTQTCKKLNAARWRAATRPACDSLRAAFGGCSLAWRLRAYTQRRSNPYVRMSKHRSSSALHSAALGGHRCGHQRPPCGAAATRN